jgi:hypothetical protein
MLWLNDDPDFMEINGLIHQKISMRWCLNYDDLKDITIGENMKKYILIS